MKLLNELFKELQQCDQSIWSNVCIENYKTQNGYDIPRMGTDDINRIALADAEEWAKEISNGNIEFLDSKNTRLQEYYCAARNWRDRYSPGDGRNDYRSIALCFYNCVMYHAAILFRECYKQKSVCAKLGFLTNHDLTKASEQISNFEFIDQQRTLCQLCQEESCPRRCCQPNSKQMHPAENVDNNALLPGNADNLLMYYPGIRGFFDRLVKGGYLNEDYSLANVMNDTCAAIVAHEIALDCNFKAFYSPFEEFWGIKDLRNKYNKAKNRGSQTKKKYEAMLTTMFRKQIDGINDEIADAKRINEAMKRL